MFLQILRHASTLPSEHQLLSWLRNQKLEKISDRNPIVRAVRRRSILKSVLGMGLGLGSDDWAAAQENDPDAPQENDLFVFAEDDREGKIIAPGDVPLGGPP